MENRKSLRCLVLDRLVPRATNGVVLPTTLAAILLLNLLIVASFFHLFETERLLALTVRSARTTDEAVGAIFKKLPDTGPTAGILLRVLQAQTSKGDRLNLSLETALSAETAPKGANNGIVELAPREARDARRYDFRSYFHGAQPCPIAAEADVEASEFRSGTEYVAVAARARTRCSFGSGDYGNIVVGGDLRLDGSVTLSRSGTLSPTSAAASEMLIVSALGRLRQTGTLRIESDLRIIAGGDIDIEQLITDEARSHTVQIVSATGSVRVRSIAGAVRCTVAAWHGVQIDGPWQSSSAEPVPPALAYEILGLAR